MAYSHISLRDVPLKLPCEHQHLNLIGKAFLIISISSLPFKKSLKGLTGGQDSLMSILALEYLNHTFTKIELPGSSSPQHWCTAGCPHHYASFHLKELLDLWRRPQSLQAPFPGEEDQNRPGCPQQFLQLLTLAHVSFCLQPYLFQLPCFCTPPIYIPRVCMEAHHSTATSTQHHRRCGGSRNTAVTGAIEMHTCHCRGGRLKRSFWKNNWETSYSFSFKGKQVNCPILNTFGSFMATQDHLKSLENGFVS